MCLKSLTKQFCTAYEQKGVAVVICPNDLLTEKIKDTTNKTSRYIKTNSSITKI